MITAHHLVFGRKAILKNKGLILDLPLQNSFTDTTGINTMIAGGTSNLPTFTLEGGEYAASFNGSQSLKTNANFLINSDKISVSFWVKTSQTALAMITELSVNAASNNAFYADINETAIGISSIESGTGGINAKSAPFTINNNTWHHVVLIVDRNLSQSISIYINGSLKALNTMYGYNANTSGNFGIYQLFIGQRAGNSLGFNGQMKFLKIFNYPLSTTEITNLYNKTI